MGETKAQSDVRLSLGSRQTGRCFRNNVGGLRDKAGRLVTFGLFPGSGDLIHIEAVTITPEMVGQTIGVFCSIEMKKEGRDTTEKDRKIAQGNWRDMVQRFGGRAGIARSVEEAIEIVEGRSI